MRSGLAPPPSSFSAFGFRGAAGFGGGGAETSPPSAAAAAASSFFSRFHRLRTASSERPGSIAAILRHLQPWRATPLRIVSSSAVLHSLRSEPLRPLAIPAGVSVDAAPLPLRDGCSLNATKAAPPAPPS